MTSKLGILGHFCTPIRGTFAHRLTFEALPENLQETATGEALQAIIDLDLDELIAIVPPRGFGCD